MSTAALLPPRRLQGGGRHDNADLYTALYCSTDSLACVSEALQNFRKIKDSDLFRGGNRLHLFKFRLDDARKTPNVDDPNVLLEFATRPSKVATRERLITQPLARKIFERGNDGMLWWSTIESAWINATLFYEQARPFMKMIGAPVALKHDSSEVLRIQYRE